MSNTAKGRLPSKPLSYKYKDLCTREEIMVDYLTGRLYVRLTSGEIVDITSIVLEDIRNFRTMDEYIYVHVPNSSSLVTIKAAYADIISRIDYTNQAIRDLQDPNIEDSLYNILTKNYIQADSELYEQVTNDYENADSILKAYVNKLFQKLGLVYHEDNDTYTIAIPNAYIVHDGVSEVYNIQVELSPENYNQKSANYYVYNIPITTEAGYAITLDATTDKIISRELDAITSKGSTLNYIMNTIESKNVQFMEYQSIAYAIVGNGAIFIFSDYKITSTMNITFTISRD